MDRESPKCLEQAKKTSETSCLIFNNLKKKECSFIFVKYLLKEVYRKIMSEIQFVGKNRDRYEDLTEIAS